VLAGGDGWVTALQEPAGEWTHPRGHPVPKGEASGGLRQEAPGLREVGWGELCLCRARLCQVLAGKREQALLRPSLLLSAPAVTPPRQAALPAHQRLPPATRKAYLPPSASGLVLSQHITAFPFLILL